MHKILRPDNRPLTSLATYGRKTLGGCRLPYPCEWRDRACYGAGKTKPLAIRVVGWRLYVRKTTSHRLTLDFARRWLASTVLITDESNAKSSTEAAAEVVTAVATVEAAITEVVATEAASMVVASLVGSVLATDIGTHCMSTALKIEGFSDGYKLH